MSSAQYTVIVTLTEDTLEKLQHGNYTLYGFTTFKASTRSKATLWFRTSKLEKTLTVAWRDSYAVYTELSENIAGGQVVGMNPYPLPQLGATLTVDSPNGIGTLASGGPSGGVRVVNKSSAELHCGLSLPQPAGTGTGGAPVPICDATLFGHNEVDLAPGNGIFLMFDNGTPTDVGVTVETSPNPGVLLTFAAGTTSQSVTYDMNHGWSGAGQNYPALTSLDFLNLGLPMP